MPKCLHIEVGMILVDEILANVDFESLEQGMDVMLKSHEIPWYTLFLSFVLFS